MPRPRLAPDTVSITMQMPAAMAQALREIAEDRDGGNVSRLLRKIIQAWLDAREGK